MSGPETGKTLSARDVCGRPRQEGVRRVDSPTGTKVTEKDRTESTGRDEAPDATDEQVVRVPEAEAEPDRPASSVATAPQEAPAHEKAPSEEKPTAEGRPTADTDARPELAPDAPTTRLPRIRKDEKGHDHAAHATSHRVFGANPSMLRRFSGFRSAPGPWTRPAQRSSP